MPNKYNESAFAKNHICPCGFDLLLEKQYANIYKEERWEFNIYTKEMELVYAICQHDKIIVNKRIGGKNIVKEKEG